MNRGLDWYKREPQAFLDGIQGMGPELIGAYAVLLDLMYARGGETLRDDHHLGGVMGCSTRKATSLTNQLIERGKIVVQGDLVTNSVVQKTARTRRNLSETRAEAGRIGGEKSGQSRKNNDLTEANASSKTQAEKSRVDIPPKSPKGDGDLFSDQKNGTKSETPLSILCQAIPKDDAEAFIEMRKKKRNPLTNRAAELIVLKLKDMPDPIACINQSIERGYTGVFPVDQKQAQRGGQRPSILQQIENEERRREGMT